MRFRFYVYNLYLSLLKMPLVTTEFIDNLSKLDIKDSEETYTLPIPIQKELKKEKFDVNKFPLTDLLRGAYYNEDLKEIVKRDLGYNPLPLKETIKVRDDDNRLITKPVKLFPHQLQALEWMKKRQLQSLNGILGGIVCLKQGLGKTLLAITHGLITPKDENFPNLVITTKTLLNEWKDHGFEQFFGDKVKVLYMHPDFGKYEYTTRNDIIEYDFICTTYDVVYNTWKKYKYIEDTVIRGSEDTIQSGKIIQINCRTRTQSNNPRRYGYKLLFSTPWENVYCDESQRFVNPTTAIYKAILSVYGKFKWCLTGTPVRNYDTDIWSQFRFCGYEGITKPKEWSKHRIHAMRRDRLTDAIFSMNYDGANVKLPEKLIYRSIININDKELECYQYVLGEARHIYDEMMNDMVSFANVLALFTKLRQCCIAPYLLTTFSKKDYKSDVDLENDRQIVNGLNGLRRGPLSEWILDKHGTAGIRSAKITAILSCLSSIPSDEKVLIFSSYTSALELITYACDELLPEFNYVQIDGSVKGSTRRETLDDFKTNPNIQGLFMTYKIGAMGLNLIEANHVILIEPWWAPDIHEQGISRAWRTGQTKDVMVYQIVINAQDTGDRNIEQRILELCEMKESLAKEILSGSKRKVSTKLDKATLGKLLGY